MARKKLALSTRYRKRLKELRLTKQTLVTVQESRAGLYEPLEALAYSMRIVARAENAYQTTGDVATLLFEIQRAIGYTNAVLTEETK